MSKNIIHIYGASGSGTSTLARCLAEHLGYAWLDTDDYFWLPTDPPYTTPRCAPERLRLIRRDIEAAEQVVISGSLVDWGDELIPLFTLAVRMETDRDIRLARLKRRERDRFGPRIDPGGDMHQNHLVFLEWAAAYDEGGLSMRSKAKHDAWETLIPCGKITLNGNDSLEHNLKIIEGCL